MRAHRSSKEAAALRRLDLASMDFWYSASLSAWLRLGHPASSHWMYAQMPHSSPGRSGSTAASGACAPCGWCGPLSECKRVSPGAHLL